MNRWNRRSLIYLALAIVGLIGTWTYNIMAVLQGRNYLGDWFDSGAAVSSLTVDVLLSAIAVIVFMVAESRRIGMRRVWVFIVLIPLVALAFSLPLFLAVRERHLAAQAAVAPES